MTTLSTTKPIIEKKAGTPLLSVIVPCRNAAAYLGQTLGSLLDQTRLPDEILVIDDGSTDASREVAARFVAATGGLVRLYARPSGSAAMSRRIGGDLARGDLLMFLDADDVLDPEVLEGLETALRDRPGAVAACRWERLEQIDGQWVRRPPSCRRWSPRHGLLGNWLRGWYHPTSTVLWSRPAFQRTGGWDTASSVNDDGNIMMRAFLEGVPFVVATTGTCFYRRLPPDERSVSSGRTSEAGLASRLWVIDKIGFRLEQQGRLDRYRQAMGEALTQLRVDAEGNADLVDRIDTCYEAYGPATPPAARPRRSMLSRGRNAARRLRQSVAPPPDEPVNYGLERAETIARSVAGKKLPPARRPRLPQVTVIIPTYNRAATLVRAIKSVVRQTYRDFELVVVDDGSTDDTRAIMERVNHPRVRYLRQAHNSGVSSARNRGLEAARGEFIAFLDSDDEWMPEKLERQLDLFRNVDDSVGLVYTGVQTVDAGGVVTEQRPGVRGDVYRKMLLRNRIHGGGSNAMIRRGVVATVGFFDESLPAIEDYDYWLRLSRFFEVDYVPEVLIRYHAPPAARKSTDVQGNLEARDRLYRLYRREMKRAGVAHLYLLESAGRYLAPPRPDGRSARRFAQAAARQRPLSRASLYAAVYTLLPAGVLQRMRSLRHARQIG